MFVYRIGKTQYASDLNGTGAKLFGGRWNHVGVPCLYTSESRSLAILEYSVNVNINYIPRALSVSIFEIEESLVKEISVKNLPGDWKSIPAPFSTKDLGSDLFKQGIPIIKVPSTVITEEYNYLVNPLAAQSNFYKLLEVKDFVYDVRIKSE